MRRRSSRPAGRAKSGNTTPTGKHVWSTVWYVCKEHERADEPDRQLLEDMGFKWPTAGLLQMAIWEEMKEYGVDQNTINDSSLLSKSKEPRRTGGTRMRMKPWAENKTLDSLDVAVESL